MAPANTRSRAQGLPIGALSRDTGVNIETIRYYERIGLMPVPPRTEGGQRVYDADHLKRLTFIRRGRELGFSLDEVRDLLGLVRGGALTCAKVKTLTEAHVAAIRSKVKDLKKLERVLAELGAQCHGKEVPICPILDALSGDLQASLRYIRVIRLLPLKGRNGVRLIMASRARLFPAVSRREKACTKTRKM